jgi:hypothetical protein
MVNLENYPSIIDFDFNTHFRNLELPIKVDLIFKAIGKQTFFQFLVLLEL